MLLLAEAIRVARVSAAERELSDAAETETLLLADSAAAAESAMFGRAPSGSGFRPTSCSESSSASSAAADDDDDDDDTSSASSFSVEPPLSSSSSTPPSTRSPEWALDENAT